MNLLSSPPAVQPAAQPTVQPAPQLLTNQVSGGVKRPELREAFNDFVGQTFYGQMLKAMRSTVSESTYFHGGRGEEVFQGQLDQVLSEKLSDASADTFTDPMFELFQLSRP